MNENKFAEAQDFELEQILTGISNERRKGNAPEVERLTKRFAELNIRLAKQKAAQKRIVKPRVPYVKKTKHLSGLIPPVEIPEPVKRPLMSDKARASLERRNGRILERSSLRKKLQILVEKLG
jgi:hypothetical protein